METCSSYMPWHDKTAHRTYLKPDGGRCLHYYFYFIDEELGLCYLRVPTWCPFRLQFYCNGHNWLARQLDKRGIGYHMLDNAFLDIDVWPTRSTSANCTGGWTSTPLGFARFERPSASVTTEA